MSALASQTPQKEARKIHVLPQDVVNRIAAGEVIVRPANAIKEMLENCIDAGSTSIRIVLKEGGLKSIQITDNGSGIRREDMPIVCERFTTSKLSTFEDLQSLNTFGFRGEALASISHVAHVTIVSMTKDSSCAYKAHYADGKLIGRDGDSPDPKPCAGTIGTTITVEDLFFNVPSRRKAMKSASEEYQRVVDVVSKYSLHYSGISMNVKKHGDNRSDVNTLRDASLKDNIRLLHGAKVVSELLEINVDVPSVDAKISGFITGPNYSGKKISFILFINNRLVDCAPLKKAVETVYSHMFQKSVHPWVYLSLAFPPHKIDPNVHPTKSEVRFLNQEEVIAEVVAQITSELEKSNLTRDFAAEGGASWSVIPHQIQTSLHDSMEVEEKAEKTSSVTPEKASTPISKPYQHQMVRTDSKSQKLESFLSPTRSRNGSFSMDQSPAARAINFDDLPASISIPPEGDDEIELHDDAMDVSPPACSHGHDHEHHHEQSHDDFMAETNIAVEDDEDDTAPSPSSKKRKLSSAVPEPVSMLQKFAADADGDSSPRQATEEFRKRKRLEQRKPEKVQLTSVANLISAFEDASHSGLRDVFSNYTFVGCFDSTRVLLQFQTRLFICDMSRLSQELAYQEALHRLGDMTAFKLATPLPLHDVLKLALNPPGSASSSSTAFQDDIEKKSLEAVALLKSKAELLQEYFGIGIDTSSLALTSIPEIIDEYPPFMGHIPFLLLNLATEVNWTEEKACLDGIARALSRAYSLHKLQFPEENVDGPTQTWIVEHVLLPSLRLRFSPPREFAKDGTVVQITSLEKLYKVFERC